MDKINIVSSQAVLEMPSFSIDTCSKSSLALVNSLVKNWLFKTATTPDINELPFQFIHTMDLSVVDTTHNPQDWDLGCLEVTDWTQGTLAFLDAAVQLLHLCGAVCQCTFLLERSHYQTLCMAGSNMTSFWLYEAASKKSVRDITRISCFVTTMKLLHALQIYLTFFVKKCRRFHFQGSAATN